MVTSVFDLFKPGIGPSSSHTMGPMTAASRFVDRLRMDGLLDATERVTANLYGSLALTGKGHGADRGIMLGLMRHAPETVDPDQADRVLEEMRRTGRLPLAGSHLLPFDEALDIIWEPWRTLPQHPNALMLAAYGAGGENITEQIYFSTGGGFVRDAEEMKANGGTDPDAVLPYGFGSGAELLRMAEQAGLTIAGLMLANEKARLDQAQIEVRLDRVVDLMDACIERGLRQGGELPGGLRVRRRARQVLTALKERGERNLTDPLAAMDWVNLWALAVNEENAAGARVVTAPTNGAAGVVPAVLRFYDRFCGGTREGRRRFLLTAGAIGALYKANASISGAEVGCQGEVGVACSMAAAALCAVLGGTNWQVENAAEIAMEHNLGLTCDPIGGLVQIPCIERNAMGAIKAIDAARLALLGDGQHSVSLDKVIATMKRTGADMLDIYKETSLGGLAIDVSVSRVEC